MLCTKTLLFIHSMYESLHLLTPTPYSIPSSTLSPLITTSKAAALIGSLWCRASLAPVCGPPTPRRVCIEGAPCLCVFYCFDFSLVLQQKHTREYGKIFKSHFGPQFVVSVADRELVAQVLRAEGASPQRANMGSWQEYRDLRGRSTGLISA